MQNPTPVLIVGAGPTGLTTAVELQRYGIPFRIIDKQIKPVKTSNALAVHVRTLELWDDLGILTAALAAGNPLRGMNIYANNKRLAHVDFDILQTSFPFVLGLAQRETEVILMQHLQEKNIPIEMEVDIIDFKEDISGVDVILQHKDGTQENLHADWLIACDGGHSFIREKLQLPFIGKELPQHFVLADMEIHSTLPLHEMNMFASDQGLFMIAQYDKTHARIIADVTHDPELREAKSLTDAQINKLAAERCPIKLELSPAIWTSGFWLHERITPQYRHHRIFFAGDAAHVHSPAGGQGMNTGIQDAYNLAWKLALVIQKKAKTILLDTYQAERYPVGKNVLRETTLLTNVMTVRNRFLRWLRDFVIAFALKQQKIRKKFASTMTLLTIKYNDNLLVQDYLRHQSGPPAGTRMLDVKYDYQRLFDLVRGTQFVLLLFSGISREFNIFQFLQLQSSLKVQYKDLIKCVFINAIGEFPEWEGATVFDALKQVHQSYGVSKPSLYLIRPDKYIGFRGALEHQQELEKYLENVLIS